MRPYWWSSSKISSRRVKVRPGYAVSPSEAGCNIAFTQNKNGFYITLLFERGLDSLRTFQVCISSAGNGHTCLQCKEE